MTATKEQLNEMSNNELYKFYVDNVACNIGSGDDEIRTVESAIDLLEENNCSLRGTDKRQNIKVLAQLYDMYQGDFIKLELSYGGNIIECDRNDLIEQALEYAQDDDDELL